MSRGPVALSWSALHRTHRDRALRAWLAVLLVLFTAPLVQACSKRVPGPAPRTVALHVENQGYFDINVFVMRSPMTRGTRLGTVSGGSSQTFRVRETDLQPGGLMVVQVRAISGRSSWTSPQLSVNIGSVARLDVISVGSGDLSRSQFYRQ